MNPSDIIDSLNKYNNEEFKSVFLNDTISYFKNQNNITEIPENENMLAGIRIHILYNKFYFYLISDALFTKHKFGSQYSSQPDMIYRQLKLSKNQVFNLESQINGDKKGTFHICDMKPSFTIESGKQSKIFLIISKNQLNLKNMEISLDISLSLIGINSLDFLEYQNLDNYCKIWKNSEKVFKELNEYKKDISKLQWQDRDRMLVSNNIIYNMMGTLTSSDMNVMMLEYPKKYLEHKTQTQPRFGFLEQKTFKEKQLIKKYNIIELNPNYLLNSFSKEKEMNEINKMNWLINKLPGLVGAPDINTMLINTKYHFYFMGVKCISIFANIEKSLFNSNTQSFLDVYLLKIINNLDCFNKLCIKNITFNNGKTSINNNNTIKSLYENIHTFAKKNYNIDIPITYIKQYFVKCTDKFDTIYKNKVFSIDPLIRQQIGIHRKMSNHYIVQYGKNKESLIDMGSGKLSSAYIYASANIKTVYGVEPSIYSVNLAKENANKNKKTNFTLIHAFADKPLNIKAQFDVITFIFTIHYMLKNLDIVINNIKKLSKPGTIIIITCVNGDKILEKLNLQTNSYEIKYYNKVYWGAYEFNSNLPQKDININNTESVLFYMKDVYGLEMGSEEYLVPVNDLIKQFQKNNIKLKYSNSFKNEYNKIPNSSKLHNFQCDILNMQQILIFEI
jgi:SAM-dependent methyltransferase